MEQCKTSVSKMTLTFFFKKKKGKESKGMYTKPLSVLPLTGDDVWL